MTIKEKYAKYTIEELEANKARLEDRASEEKEIMEYFKAEKNIEFYEIAKNNYERIVDILFDINAALINKK